MLLMRQQEKTKFKISEPKLKKIVTLKLIIYDSNFCGSSGRLEDLLRIFEF